MPETAPRHAPPDGLVLRPWRDESDWQLMADISNSAMVADRRDGLATAAGAASMVSQIPSFDPVVGHRIAELDGRAVGWSLGAAEREEGDDIRLLLVRCRVDPTVRGRGVGTALMAAAEDGARRHAATTFAGEARRRVFEAWLDDGERDARALLERHGYVPSRWGHAMDRDLAEPIPDAPLPDGIVIRPTTLDERVRVLIAWDEASRDSWEYGGMEADELPALLGDPNWADLAHWVIAWEGDEPVGGSLGNVDVEENERFARRRGYVERIWTRRPWRGRGIAGAVIAHALRQLRDEGLDTAHLMVDADNPFGAGTLYERMGFRIVEGGLVVLRKPAD